MTVRLVLITVEGTRMHCSNNCTHMVLGSSNNGAPQYCDLFKTKLTWDKRKKTHGYKRLKVCKDSEYPPKVTDR